MWKGKKKKKRKKPHPKPNKKLCLTTKEGYKRKRNTKKGEERGCGICKKSEEGD